MKDGCKYFTVFGHGDKDTVAYYPDGKGTGNTTTPQELADMIKADPDYVSKSPILMLTCCPCSSGNKVYPLDIATSVANILGVDVIGASCSVTFISDPSNKKLEKVELGRQPKDPPGPDEWRTRPGPESPKQPTPPPAPKPPTPDSTKPKNNQNNK
jgi:hypothetical protein